MPHLNKKSNHDSIRERLESLISSFDTSVPASLAEAMQSLLAAVNYNDVALIKSSVESVFAAVEHTVREEVEKRLEWSQRAVAGLHKAMVSLEDEPIEPDEESDEIGKQIAAMHEKLQPTLIELHAGMGAILVQRLPDLAARLVNEINNWKVLKENLLDRWPWSAQEPHPVDRSMVTDSRKAFDRNEGKPIEDLINQLGGN